MEEGSNGEKNEINGEQLVIVQVFEYLSSIITNDGKFDI